MALLIPTNPSRGRGSQRFRPRGVGRRLMLFLLTVVVLLYYGNAQQQPPPPPKIMTRNEALKVLGLSGFNYSEQVLKDAYKKRALESHPYVLLLTAFFLYGHCLFRRCACLLFCFRSLNHFNIILTITPNTYIHTYIHTHVRFLRVTRVVRPLNLFV